MWTNVGRIMEAVNNSVRMFQDPLSAAVDLVLLSTQMDCPVMVHWSHIDHVLWNDMKTMLYFAYFLNFFSSIGMDACLTNNGGCQQICMSTPTGAMCACEPGYELEADQRNCRGVSFWRRGSTKLKCAWLGYYKIRVPYLNLIYI